MAFFVDMANTSMAGKPLMSVTPKSTNGFLLERLGITAEEANYCSRSTI
jgi:hypothetical protein